MKLNADKIYVSFERNNRFYRGSLSPVCGAGAQANDTYYLMIDQYFYGKLRRTGSGWVFDNNYGWNDLAVELGRQVDAKEKSK